MGYKHNAEDIISKGAELFRKKGYHNVGINEILKACEIPKGSFYNFFDTKEKFTEKVIESYGTSSLNMIVNALGDKSKSPLERLKQFYSMLIDINEKDGMDAGCLLNNLSIEVGGFNPGISKVADKIFKIWIEEIARCVEEGQDEGEIIDTMPAEDIAEYMHAGLFGAFSRMKVNRNRVYLDKWYNMTFEFISKI
ncbi:MAG: TetR/AcrR family transcriptional regulator [Cyclobacteriaceae bacterium]|nr:TetR/AcrR family transcriptional regulator [Cyclobacteriaceae bacterium]